MSIASIQNAGLSALNDLVGWDDVSFNIAVSTGNPAMGFQAVNKEFPIRALISKNTSAYEKSDNTNNEDFKLCKVFVSDIEELNTTYGVNIPTDQEELKSKEITIEVTRGNVYQITKSSSGSFNDKTLIVLEIERNS